MAGLDLYCSNEATIIGMRPDIWVIVHHGRPVGVLEVKKPELGILEAPAVVGQILDYLHVLRHQFGVLDPYAIGTTFEQWRVLHLPKDDKVAGTRVVEASPVIDGYGNAEEFCTAMVAALQLMRNSPLKPLPTAPPLEIGIAQAYMRATRHTWSWVTLAAPITLQYSKMAAGNIFVLVRDLGAGAHGHAWLASSTSGCVCVLKIARRMGASTGLSRGCAVMRITTPKSNSKMSCWSGTW